jgi:DNA-3-methyladenine glycosylase I
MKADAKRCCPWPGNDELMLQYHDREWGTPLHDDRRLFEFLILEGMQAGLSWRTILHKRENFRKAFHGFDPGRISRYGDRAPARRCRNHTQSRKDHGRHPQRTTLPRGTAGIRKL